MALSLASADADESSYSRSTPQTDNTPPIPHSSGLMCGGVYKQDDVVGQYLAQRATQQAYFDHVQSFQQGYVTEQAGYLYPGHHHNYTVSHTAVVMLSRDCHIPIRNTFATCTLYTPYYPTSSPNAKSTPLVVQNWISSMVSATFYATLSPKSYSSSFLAAP